MATKYAVGIDPHKQLIVAGLFDIENRLQPIKYFDLPQDIKDFEQFYSNVVSYSSSNVSFCMEDVDGNGKPLRLFLQSKNAVIYHVPANYTYQYKRNNPNPEKSDYLDCKYIVQAWLIEPGIQQLRLNLEEDIYLQIRDTAYERWEAGQSKGTIKKKINSRLFKKLGPNYKKHFTNTMYTKIMLDQAKSMLEKENDPHSIMILSLIKDLERTESKCKELDLILKLLVNDDVKKIMEIKGCGLVLAASIVGIIKSGYKPKNGKSIAKWAGIAPIEQSTGGTVTHHSNKRGYRHLNHLIHQIMITQLHHTAIKKDFISKVYFQKRIKAGDNKHRAEQKVKNAISHDIFKRLFRSCNIM